MFRQRTQLIVQSNEDYGAEGRPQEMMDAAQNRHHYGVARVLPIQVIGINALNQERQQASRKPDNAGRDDEGYQLQTLGVVSETAHALLIVAQRLQHTPERRVDDAPNRVH